MQIRVLGAAAGGGFPQWNAGDDANRRARAGDPAAKPATQASIAVSADGARWFVVNASPDLGCQIAASPCLHPAERRGSPIAGVIVTNADIDAIAGLLTLREGTPFALYAPAAVHRVLDANPIFEVVSRDIVPRRTLGSGWRDLCDADGVPAGLALRAVSVPGKAPLFLETDRDPNAAPVVTEGATIGLEIRADGPSFYYLANIARLDPALAAAITGAALVFFDGTLFTDDEMVRCGVGLKSAARMGHMAMVDAMAALEPLRIGRKIFIHINNTNPVLLSDSPERRMVERRGFEIAHDGMEVTL